MKKTVILQGSVKNKEQVQKCINSIRLWHTEKIIISTWRGEEADFYGIDDVIFCEDPGPGPFNGLHPVEQHCNLKRQIFGFREALNKLDTDEIVFKVRNDCISTKNVFNIFESKKCNGSLSLFDNKIFVSNIMTINPFAPSEPKPGFRISDWLYIGFKRDLEKMCNIYEDIDKTDYSDTLLGTEHILSYNLLKKYKFENLTLGEFSDLKNLSWKYILDNFVVLNTNSTLGVKNIGKWKDREETFYCYVTEEEYNEMYNVMVEAMNEGR